MHVVIILIFKDVLLAHHNLITDHSIVEPRSAHTTHVHRAHIPHGMMELSRSTSVCLI